MVGLSSICRCGCPLADAHVGYHFELGMYLYEMHGQVRFYDNAKESPSDPYYIIISSFLSKAVFELFSAAKGQCWESM